MNPTSSLLAAAVSSDGKFLAVGGGDKMVHVFEAGSGTHVQVRSKKLGGYPCVCKCVGIVSGLRLGAATRWCMCLRQAEAHMCR
jgi:hypothetical protein